MTWSYPPGDEVHSFEELARAAVEGTRPVKYKLRPNEQLEASKRWSQEYLIHQVGDVPVTIHQSSTGNYFDFEQSLWELARSAFPVTRTVREIVTRVATEGAFEIVSGTDTHLLLETGVVGKWSTLWEDCHRGLRAIVPYELHRVGFWVSKGASGTCSQMHWDINGDHNLNFQILGRKRIIMFSPEDGPHLYPMPGRLFHLSRIDPRPGKHSLEAHPLFETAKYRGIEFDLDEGEVLLIPAGWYHHVTHYADFNVNITAWYASPRSNRAWTLESLVVPKAREAYGFVAKLVLALILVQLWSLSKRIWDGATKRFSSFSRDD